MNLIAEDLRNSIVELRFEFDLLVLQINLHKRQNRQDKLIDVDESLFLQLVFEHRTKVLDNVARPVATIAKVTLPPSPNQRIDSHPGV
ncbi:MAG: hypothetical protein WAL09_10080, partial [Pseudolabrys sp.]